MSNRGRCYTVIPRSVVLVRVACHAAPGLFLPWERMTVAAQREFETNGPIPCEGGGAPGEWCAGCRFGEINEPRPIDD